MSFILWFVLDEPNLVWSSEKGRVEDINNHPINILGGLYAILITLRLLALDAKI